MIKRARVSSPPQQQFLVSQGSGQPGREVRARPPLSRTQLRLQDIHVLRDARRVDDIVLGRLQPGDVSRWIIKDTGERYLPKRLRDLRVCLAGPEFSTQPWSLHYSPDQNSSLNPSPQNIHVCTVYTNLGEDGILHAMNETGCSVVVTSHDLMPKFEQLLAKLPQVTHLVYFEVGTVGRNYFCVPQMAPHGIKMENSMIMKSQHFMRSNCDVKCKLKSYYGTHNSIQDG